MPKKMLKRLLRAFPAPVVHAHCDAPCGVYDPASARIAAEAVLSLTKKILGLEEPASKDKEAHLSYHNMLVRYIQIKEQQAEIAKRELLILWTDYFKPQHLEAFPDLHDIFWEAAKACSACKVGISLEHAEGLLAKIQEIHERFWQSKGRKVAWMTAA